MLRVEVGHGQHELRGVVAGHVVGKAALAPQVREELSALHVLEHEVESPLVLEVAQVVDDERVLDLAQDLHLALDVV